MGYFSDPKFKNINIYASVDVNVRSAPYITSNTLLFVAKKGDLLGATTGQAYQESSDDLLFIEIQKGSDKYWAAYKYLSSKYVSGETPTDSDSQEVLNALMKQDYINYNLGLTVYFKIIAFKQNGVDVSSIEQKFLRIYNQFLARQDYLKKSPDLTEKKVAEMFATIHDVYSNSPYFPGFRGLGALQFIAVLIIALVAFGSGFALYQWLKPAYDESKRNYQEIAELEALLDKIDTPTANKIRDEIEKQIDDAYNAGKTDQWFGDIGTFIKPLLWVGLGAFIIIKGIPLISSSINKGYKQNDSATH